MPAPIRKQSIVRAKPHTASLIITIGKSSPVSYLKACESGA
jgi:hypothetical protein